MHQLQRINVLQIAIIISDSIVRQTNKVHFLSYTTINNKHIFYYNCSKVTHLRVRTLPRLYLNMSTGSVI